MAKAPKTAIRVGVLDDHILVSELLGHALTNDDRFALVGIATNLNDGLSLIEMHQPHVVLVDDGLLSKGIASATKNGLNGSGETRIVLMCESAATLRTDWATDPSVAGVIIKDRPVNEILEAVSAVARGEDFS